MEEIKEYAPYDGWENYPYTPAAIFDVALQSLSLIHIYPWEGSGSPPGNQRGQRVS